MKVQSGGSTELASNLQAQAERSFHTLQNGQKAVIQTLHQKELESAGNEAGQL